MKGWNDTGTVEVSGMRNEDGFWFWELGLSGVILFLVS
jgi:hypothetical protein